MTEEEIVSVQLGLRLRTIQQIDRIQKIFHTNNRTEAIVMAVRVLDDILNQMAVGNIIELRTTNGEVKEFEIV